MAKNYEKLASEIIEHVGGEKNIKSLRHCITRLRFELYNTEQADTEYLKNHDDIVSVVQSGGQYQVVIGNDVADVYEAIIDQTSFEEESSENSNSKEENANKNLIERFIDVMSSLFQPILAPLSAAGMIKGIVAIMEASGSSAETSGIFAILEATGDAFFQYLPIFLAVTAARRFKMNMFTGIAIAASMLYPALLDVNNLDPLYTLFSGTPFESTIHSTFAGIPIILPPDGYFFTVIPIILAILFGSKVESFISSKMPGTVRSFLTPFFTLLITVPISILVIGPISNWGANLMGALLISVYDISPILFGIILGGLWQILVMFGLHWGISTLAFIELAEGGTSLLLAGFYAVNFAQLGVLLAVMLKTKEQKVKTLGIPASISAIVGVTEPAIYGITLPMKTPFIMSCIAGAIQGAYIGLFNVTAYSLAGMGVFSIPAFTDPSGQGGMNIIHYIIAILIALISGFVLTLFIKIPTIFGDDEKDGTKTVVEETTEEHIISPLSGKLLELAEVPDEVFSSGMMGKGIAIDPSSEVVKSPVSGTITTIFPSNHAIGIISDKGAEILVHIGVDTVEMNGEGFQSFVSQEEKVEAGQTLLEFDKDKIVARQLSPITSIIVTNGNEFRNIEPTETEEITTEQNLLTITK